MLYPASDWNITMALLLNKLELYMLLDLELIEVLEQIQHNADNAKELTRREAVAKWEVVKAQSAAAKLMWRWGLLRWLLI